MSSLAQERMEILLSKALERAREGYEVGRLVELAISIGEKTNTSIPEEFRQRICRSCNSIILPESGGIRLNSDSKNIVYTCKECGEVDRHGY